MTALPRLSSAQANALRLAARGGLFWNGACWLGGHLGVNMQAVRQATVNALDRHDYLITTRSFTLHPSETGRAWLAANPESQA